MSVSGFTTRYHVDVMGSTYRLTSSGFAFTGPGTGDEPTAGALGVEPAAPITLTAAFFNLNVPVAAAGWTAKLPCAS
jgi:hypothetical protein